MGKCVSKQQRAVFGHTESVKDFSQFEAHSTVSDYSDADNNEGQSESKKNSKINGPQTKGTAMSFGFKKKVTGSKKTEHQTANSDKDTDCLILADKYNSSSTVISSNNIKLDDNGNAENKTQDLQIGQTTPRLTAAKKDMASGKPSNRFGFRQHNIIRPASVGLTPRPADNEPSINSNRNVKFASDNRRSKSAPRMNAAQSQNLFATKHIKRPIPKINNQLHQHQYNEKQNRNIQQQSLGVRNESVNSTSGTNNRFQSGHYLDGENRQRAKPNDRTDPQVLVSKFTLHTVNLPKPQYPIPVSVVSNASPRSRFLAMDTKVAKQALNTSRRQNSVTERSLDSGFLSSDSGITTRSRNRPRNLEMVMSGRHTFEVRDLDDSYSDELILPQLPNAFNPSNQVAPLVGLVRAVNNPQSNDSDNIFEEKVFRDNSTNEKGNKSKASSPSISSRASWSNAGESMANKDCSSFSLSSADSGTKPDLIDIISPNLTSSGIQSPVNQTAAIKRAWLVGDETSKSDDLTSIEGHKFAEMAAATGSDSLLEDETSPADSLASNRDTHDGYKTNTKKIILKEEYKEKNLDDISPELEDIGSPFSPGSPTNFDNSLSSDADRDFLIDDEIADQPALCLNENNDSSDTLTMKASTLSIASKQSASLRCISPLVLGNPTYTLNKELSRKSGILHVESTDTLSPCNSIASDDLMMDFDCASSMDSIDRRSLNVHELDEAQMWMKFDTKGNNDLKDYSLMAVPTRSQRQQAPRDSIIAQLPARATRLLNRSRIQQTEFIRHGSDSPSSMDSFGRRTMVNSSPGSNSSHTNDDVFLMDRGTKHAMMQDMMYCKSQLNNLRRILQETDTLNPFDMNNGQIFKPSSGTTEYNSMDTVNSNTPSLSDEQRQELLDLRRQVVYLQSQIDDRDHTIKVQEGLIEKLQLEAAKKIAWEEKPQDHVVKVNSATQTNRIRPIPSSFGVAPDELTRSKTQYNKYQFNQINRIPAIQINKNSTIIANQESVNYENNGIDNITKILLNPDMPISPRNGCIHSNNIGVELNKLTTINKTNVDKTDRNGEFISNSRSLLRSPANVFKYRQFTRITPISNEKLCNSLENKLMLKNNINQHSTRNGIIGP